MTTPNEAAEAIYLRLETALTGVTPFTFENEDFDEPDGDWVRLSVLTKSRIQETLGPIGGRRYFSGASILVQCYTKTDQGRQGADTLARTITDLFEGISFSGVNGNNAIAREGPPKGKWLQTVVEIEFTYDETK